MCRLAKAVTKYPFPSGWISRYLPGFAAVGAVRGFDVRGEDIVPAVLVDTADEPDHFSLRSAEPVLPISLRAAVLERVMFFVESRYSRLRTAVAPNIAC